MTTVSNIQAMTPQCYQQQSHVLAGRLKSLMTTQDAIELHKCVEQANELFCINVAEGWKLLRETRLHVLLRNLAMSRSTYGDPTFCSSVLSFLADIVDYASGLHKRVEDPVVDQLLAWGDRLWGRLFAVLDDIAGSNRHHPCIGDSLAELTLAYHNLYYERERLPNLIMSHYGSLVMYAWMYRLGSGKENRALHIFDNLLTSATAAECSAFCQSFIDNRAR
ncbi:hypothetical protein DENSPDRAFT_146108 [Dentipellis sp. KUC8613]|nr:hypothetical protein DENSPDRAFT_146108 [Dentipellis sp. KUC8613]